MKSYVCHNAAVKPLSAPKISQTHMVASVLAIAIATLIAIPVACAQTQGIGQKSVEQFNVPAGDLSSALLQFGEQSGLQFNVDSTLTDGKQSKGVRGNYAVDRALIELLSGSGLSYRYSGPRTVVIEPATELGDAHQLGPLRIGGSAGGGAGTATGSAINGVNGSGDVTSTEGSGSFTSGALTIASKMPLSIKDTAQSVSVITHQRMIEQNITDFDTLLDNTPGVTSVTGASGPLENAYYSRGFQIQRVQIDGGAPIDIADTNWGMSPLFDMSIYDHAEILRGADGLFNGFGNAGGVVSLQRKRPLDHFQMVVEGQAGSWDNYRSMLDVTGAIALDGRLRGRAVATWQDQDFFYDIASNRKEILYGVLDFDLTSTTVLTLGFTRTLQDAVPATGGLPRYQNGADIGFSRDTCLCMPWGSYNIDNTELFLTVEQLLGESWSLKGTVTHDEQDRSIKYGSVTGTVNPVTGTGTSMSPALEREGSEQLRGELVLNGAFQWLGHTQQLVVSVAGFEADGIGKTTYANLGYGTSVDVLDFDPYSSAYPDNTSTARVASYYPEYRQSQQSFAANLRLTFWDPLHFEIGFKYNYLESKNVREAYCARNTCLDTATNIQYVAGDLMSIFPSSYKDEEVSWPPAVKIIYDVNDEVSAYVSYTDIYKEQTTNIDYNGNSIDPITGANYEAGLKWAGRDGRLNGSLSVYRIEEKGNGIYLGTSENFPAGGSTVCCYSSDGDFTKVSKGLDLELTGELLPGWQLAASYTWNQNVEKGKDAYTGDGEALQTRFPKHMIKLWSSYRFQSGDWLSRLTLSAGVNAKSRAYYAGTACLGYSESGSCNGGYADYDFAQGFYAVTSARASYQLSKRWQLSVNAENIFDRRYWQTISNTRGGNWYGEPRNYTLTVRGQF